MTSGSELVDRWEEKFSRGDHSDDEACLGLLKAELKADGEPLLFRAATGMALLQFIEAREVDLFQKADDGSTILMDNLDRFELEAYGWLADRFSERDAIDWGDEEGVTPLASQIRFGRLRKSRILLEFGASVATFATLPRYGGQKMDVAMQAALCSPLEGDAESAAIEALELLVKFGFQASADQKQHLLSRVSDQKPRLCRWISDKL